MSRNKATFAETIAAQAAGQIDEKTGAVIPPIHLASTYARDENYELRGFTYSRFGSPTSDQAETILMQLEEAKDALLFNSGLSAAVSVIESLPAGAHIVLPETMYFAALYWMRRQAKKGYIQIAMYQPGNLDSLKSAITPKTDMVWVETPANPTWVVTDIAASAAIAHENGAILVVDGTGAPPPTTKALELGADIVFHSATKYLNGHSDITAGVLSTNNIDEQWADIIDIRKHQGTVLPAFESWLLIRGLRTLYVRWDKACENAMKIATHFSKHPKIENVLYPGLQSDPGYAVASHQMTRGFGGMMSFLVQGDQEQTKAVAKHTQHFLPATSLGGVESLIEHRYTIEGPALGTPTNLLRISIGIENVDDLIHDLEQALNTACN